MANGAIVGECPICDEWIYEDEWELTGNIMHHDFCKVTDLVAKFAKFSLEEQKRVFEYAGLGKGKVV